MMPIELSPRDRERYAAYGNEPGPISLKELLHRPIRGPSSRGFQKGISFNMADEIAGLLRGDEARDEVRRLDAEAEEAHPGLFMAGEFGGEALSLLAPGAGLAGKAVSKLPALGRVGAGAGVGAGVEGGRGFAGGRGGFEDRAESAAVPAALGGAIGGGIFAPGAVKALRAHMNAPPRAVEKSMRANVPPRAVEKSQGGLLDSSISRRDFLRKGGKAGASLATVAAAPPALKLLREAPAARAAAKKLATAVPLKGLEDMFDGMYDDGVLRDMFVDTFLEKNPAIRNDPNIEFEDIMEIAEIDSKTMKELSDEYMEDYAISTIDDIKNGINFDDVDEILPAIEQLSQEVSKRTGETVDYAEPIRIALQEAKLRHSPLKRAEDALDETKRQAYNASRPLTDKVY